MSNPINVSGQDNFKVEVLDSKLPVLVDFWAPWCGPCQMMVPVLDQLAVELEGKVKIVKVDTEDSNNQRLAIDFEIQSIPNMKLFKDGKVIKDFVGFRPKEMLLQDLNQLI